MAEEGGEMPETARRRSARISALEEDKKKKEEQSACAAKSNKMTGTYTPPTELRTSSEGGVPHSQNCEVGEQEHDPSPTVRQYDRRRVPKRKRLEDVVVTSLAYPSLQVGENQKHGSTSIRNDQHPSSSSQPRIPEARVLEFVLDILQRRDTQEIFSQPVDPTEVEGYYRIIKEPMDFGTMRAKLHEEMYTSLEQFEHDVFLICSNAMHFNSSTTIFYREARGILELAQRVFHALRTDPENFLLEFSLTRRRPGRKLQSEARGQCTKSVISSKRNNKMASPSSLSPRFDQIEKEAPPGCGGGLQTERRLTYRPWTSSSTENASTDSLAYGCLELPFCINHGDFGYKESLMRFVKYLGPTAQKVANKKLSEYLQIEASDGQSQDLTSLANTPNCLVSAPSLIQPPASRDDVDHGALPQSMLYDLPGNFNVIRNANKQSNNHGDVSKGENTPISFRSNSHDGAYKGKMACTDSRTDLHSDSARDTVPSSESIGNSGNLRTENGHFNPPKDVQTGPSAAYTGAVMHIYGRSKGKTIYTNDNMDLHENVRHDANEGQTRPIWLDTHFPWIGNDKINVQDVRGNTNICSKYRPMNMMGEFSHPSKEQLLQSATELKSRLLEFISRNNNYPDASFLPPQATKWMGNTTNSMVGLLSPSDGGSNTTQAGQSLKWSGPTMQQAVCDMPTLQMQLNKDKFFGNGTVLHQPSHLLTAHKMALLHAMSFYEMPTPESHQAETSAQCPRDIQGQSSADTNQLDLALQL